MNTAASAPARVLRSRSPAHRYTPAASAASSRSCGSRTPSPSPSAATIAQEDFKLRLRIPEEHARFLKAGDRIRLDGGEFDEHTAKSGVIDLVYPQVEEGRVVADAKVQGLGEYFVGDRRRVWIAAGQRPAFVIPSSYVTTRFGIDYVKLRQADDTVSVPVQRGRDHPTATLAALAFLSADAIKHEYVKAPGAALVPA